MKTFNQQPKTSTVRGPDHSRWQNRVTFFWIGIFKGPMACYFMDAYISGPLIQYLKTFKKFSRGTE